MPGGKAPKQKGTRYERELVDLAKDIGLRAERAWGSDGRSIGLSSEVDILVEGRGIQAKRVKKLAKRLTDPLESDDVYAVVFREDRGTNLALIEYSTLLALIAFVERKDA